MCDKLCHLYRVPYIIKSVKSGRLEVKTSNVYQILVDKPCTQQPLETAKQMSE